MNSLLGLIIVLLSSVALGEAAPAASEAEAAGEMVAAKERCLREGERLLGSVETPAELAELEELVRNQKFSDYRMSDLVPMDPKGKQRLKNVSLYFGRYKTSDAHRKACQDYENATRAICSQLGECHLKELTPEQARINAKILGSPENGIHRFNMNRLACLLVEIA